MKTLFLLLGGSVALFAVAWQVLFPNEKEMELDWASLANNRTVLVTGANSGLGLATVKLLAKTGAPTAIIMGCRNATKCKQAQAEVQVELPSSSQTRVMLVSIDLGNRHSILKASHSVQEKLLSLQSNTTIDTSSIYQATPSLDILINNAGVMGGWAEREFIESVEGHITVNHLGHVLLTHYLWNNLLASTNGARIVHVSSLISLVSFHNVTQGWYDDNYHIHSKGRMGKVFNTFDSLKYYAQSKRANLMQAYELHKRYYKSSMGKISSVASHPGYTRSELMLKWQFPLVPKFVKDFAHSNRILSMSNEEGAKTQLYAALAPIEIVPSGSLVAPKFWTLGTPYLVGSLMTRFCTHFWRFSTEESSQLWDESIKALGIKTFGEP